MGSVCADLAGAVLAGGTVGHACGAAIQVFEDDLLPLDDQLADTAYTPAQHIRGLVHTHTETDRAPPQDQSWAVTVLEWYCGNMSRTLTDEASLDVSSLGQLGVVGVPAHMQLLIQVQTLELALEHTGNKSEFIQKLKRTNLIDSFCIPYCIFGRARQILCYYCLHVTLVRHV